MDSDKFKSEVYLDHAGAGKFTEKQMCEIFEDLRSLNFGNPHSRNLSSRTTTDIVDQARFRVLKHFNTNLDEYSLIFTSGATASLKLVAECFNFDVKPCHRRLAIDPTNYRLPKNHKEPLVTPNFTYLTDNHTSVIGMREVIDKKSIHIYGATAEEIEHRFSFCYETSLNGDTPVPPGGYKTKQSGSRNLFVFPGESNFSGRKYPLQWIEMVQNNCLGPGQWFVCLDAACLVGTSPLDLQKFKPDFVALSFYKIFGYPTGLGALLVRNSRAHVLEKRYFGGGTVTVNLGTRDFHEKRKEFVERFEDGTINYLGIAALRHGFDAINEAGGIEYISRHVFDLARRTVIVMNFMKHGCGTPIAEFYCDRSNFAEYSFYDKQGGIVNFNLLKPDGSYVGFTEVEKMAELYNINLRTGCFCNQGACQEFLGITDEQLVKNFQEGKVCGDEIDLIDNRPVGSVRISFGFTSRTSDVVAFLGMVFDCFVVEPKFEWEIVVRIIDDDLANRLKFDNSGRTANCSEKSIFNEPNESDQKNESINDEFVAGNRSEIDSRSKTYRSSGEKSEQFTTTIDKENQSNNSTIIDHQLNDNLSIQIDVLSGPNQTMTETSNLHLTDIMLYPIKSARPIFAESWEISKTGLSFDRVWMVASKTGVCLTQKQCPKLCSIQPEVFRESGILKLNAEGVKTGFEVGPMIKTGFEEERNDELERCEVKVCMDRVSMVDCGNDVSKWLENVLETPGVRLLRQTDTIQRTTQEQEPDSLQPVSLANVAQFLLLHRSSIRYLHSIVSKSVSGITEDDLVHRLRGNIIVDGGQPFEEDAWKSVRIGNVGFKVVGKCQRCQMICIDQVTGEKDPNILTSLRDIRKGTMTFGVYLQAETEALNHAKLIKGDSVTVQL